jgi:hypothetical protein
VLELGCGCNRDGPQRGEFVEVAAEMGLAEGELHLDTVDEDVITAKAIDPPRSPLKVSREAIGRSRGVEASPNGGSLPPHGRSLPRTSGTFRC